MREITYDISTTTDLILMAAPTRSHVLAELAWTYSRSSLPAAALNSTGGAHYPARMQSRETRIRTVLLKKSLFKGYELVHLEENRRTHECVRPTSDTVPTLKKLGAVCCAVDNYSTRGPQNARANAISSAPFLLSDLRLRY